jgi:hypothetical protein
LSSDSRNPEKQNTRDISVLQLLTKLVRETDRLVQLADDIDTHATTPQAKSAFNLIGSEVNNILTIIKTSLEPLYKIYEVDPGMQALEQGRRSSSVSEIGAEVAEGDDSYDEQALWSDLKK